MMPLDLAIGVGLFLLALIGLVLFGRVGRMRRALRRMPLASIAQVRDGDIVKIVGRVALFGELLRAPITGRPCALYRVRAFRSTKFLFEEVRCTEFGITDATGTARIRFEDAALFVDTHVGWNTHHRVHFQVTPPEVEAMLARHGHSSRRRLFQRGISYAEGAFEPDEIVVAAGRARWESTPGTTDRQLWLEAHHLTDDPATVRRNSRKRRDDIPAS